MAKDPDTPEKQTETTTETEATQPAKSPALPPGEDGPNDGLHQEPRPVEVLMRHLGKPLLDASQVVEEMNDDEKASVIEAGKQDDPNASSAAYAAAKERLLERNKATEKESEPKS